MPSTYALVTVRVPKRVDVWTAPSLAKDLEEKIQEGIAIVLDLTQTQFIEPASANVLLEGLIKSRARNARMTLRGVNPQVKVVLEMAGVLKHFRRKHNANHSG
ncbi:MAG: STAS domain-containing protein [Leptolyngbyaceae cyanobacterium SL_5_9]|nr:STAS domain-containing protein [Leptolyngbyaceae cyanobacterium SL_5_9]NJO72303.1 STAS domain-containing protein [Leptolyngbyaceae cyanobacterium RM1_406_9]